jgi:hypothetical protein
MKTMINLSIIAAATLISAHAFAASFSDFDTDSDGYISQKEAKVSSTLTQLFDRLDADGDGKISQKEFKALDSEQ